MSMKPPMKPHKPHKKGWRSPYAHDAPDERRRNDRDGKEGRNAGAPGEAAKPRGDESPRPRRETNPTSRRGEERTSNVARVVRERWHDAPRTTRAEPIREGHARRGDPPREDSSPGEETLHAPVSFVHGVKPVLEILRARTRPLERVLISETAHDSRLREIVEAARAGNVPVRRVNRFEIERLTGAEVNHQGVVALTAAALYRDADELLASVTADNATRPPLLVVLDGVEDPRNLGAIIRTAECSGAHGVFVPERRAAGLTETVAKTAAGALEHLPIARAGNIVELLARMKERGVWTIGTAADAETDYTDWDWRVPSALVLGGEGAGLRRLVRERCDALVRIPLLGHIESLNVSVAAGVVLYEAVRQRGKVESGKAKGGSKVESGRAKGESKEESRSKGES